MVWIAKRWHWLLLIGSLAFNAGVGTTFGVRAYRHQMGYDVPPGPRQCLALSGELGLRDDQIAAVRAERRALRAEMMKFQEALRHEYAVLADLIVAKDRDHNAIVAEVDKLAEMQRTKQQKMVDHVLRFSDLLDDDQRAVFAGSIERILRRSGLGPPGRGGRGRHFGRFGPGGQGRHRGQGD